MVSHRQTRTEKNGRIPASIIVVAFVFAAGVGYILGTFNNQIVGKIAPIFGLNVVTDTLDLSDLQATYQSLKANYDGEIDDKALIEGANRGMVDALGDEYTVYMNPDESEEFSDSLSGTIGGGIGVEIALRSERLTIVRLLRDNPAEKAGLRSGDVVTAINGQTTDGWTVEKAVSEIRGEAGTTVKLSILRGEDADEYTITRAEVNNPSVYTSIEDGVGVMTITRFDSETGALAREAAREFKDKNVSGVVLDLRGNGGGYITAAQEVAGLWLENELVVSERKQDTVIDELRSGRNAILKGVSTIVLVNGSSASASEIVAGALQDYEVASIMGEKTFGKGSVQKLVSLPGGAELKVTVARWYTPKGANISEQGITPDTIESITPEDLNAGRDPQLDAARDAL